MSEERTPQQAMQDAIDSGAVQAWIDGDEVDFKHINLVAQTSEDHPIGAWVRFPGICFKYRTDNPDFANLNFIWRPAPKLVEGWVWVYADGATGPYFFPNRASASDSQPEGRSVFVREVKDE